MDFDKEEQEFKDELDAGKFKIERIPNDVQDDYEKVEERNLTAYNKYLSSDYFTVLNRRY